MGGVGVAILIIAYLLNRGEERVQATKRVSPSLSEHSGGILILRFLAILFLAMVSIGFAERSLESISFESIAGTLLCAAPIPVLLLPRWTVWRIFRPLGWYQAARWTLWLTSSPDADYQGMKNLLAVSMGQATHYPMESDEPVDRWTHLIEAIRTDTAQDFDKLDTMLALIARLPRKSPVRKRLPKIGVEMLALRSADRGDWPRVQRLASLRSSRLMRLLSAIADVRQEHEPPGNRQKALWLIAPYRRRMWRLMFDEQARTASQAKLRSKDDHTMSPHAPAFLAHMDLLWGVSDLPEQAIRAPKNSERPETGPQVPREALAVEINQLINRWDAHWNGDTEIALSQRARALGAPDPLGAVDAIRARIVDELVELVLAGEVPPTHDGNPGPIRFEVAAQLEDRVFGPLQRCLDRVYEGDEVVGLNASPMAEWRAWLEMTRHVERVEALLGIEGLQTAWYNGLRLAAWNWPCRLGERYGIETVWACYLQHRWVAELAERVGDEEAAQTNWGNMEIMAKH